MTAERSGVFYLFLGLSLPDDVEFEVATDSGATSVRRRSGAPPRVVLAGQIGPEATFPIFDLLPC